MELVEHKVYEKDALKAVEYAVNVDEENGIEETTIVIYLQDGNFKSMTFSREM